MYNLNTVVFPISAFSENNPAYYATCNMNAQETSVSMQTIE